MDLTATNPDRLDSLETHSEKALLTANISVKYGRGVTVLRRLSLSIQPREIVGLIGSSGSGKSTLALCILRLIGFKGGTVSGAIALNGKDLLTLSEREMRSVRGREISFVPQSPLSSLNPALTLGAQFRETWRAHSSAPEWKRRVFELLDKVGLPSTDAFLASYPRQLSVGMAQRVLVAMAALHRPKLLIADEPTSALDAINATAILDLCRLLNEEEGTAVLCISHDLASVAQRCHRIAILHEGEIVETGDVRSIFTSPQHTYSKALVQASRTSFSLREA